MPAADMPLIVDLAGRDDELRAPLDDLRLGRWSAARDLLRRTGPDWELRTSRSLVLSVGAGSLGAIKAWLSEEPFSADALMMWARVLTREALRAMDEGRDRDLVLQAGAFARDACFGAVGRWPEDPVPWVDLLRLAKLPVGRGGLRLLDPYFIQRLQLWGQSIEMNRWDEAPEKALFPGPWPLLHEADRRHPGSREAYHRMREYAELRAPWLAVDFTRWASGGAPEDSASALHMLPLHAFVTEYQRRHGSGEIGALSFWTSDQIRHYARRARFGWFESTPPKQRSRLSLLDLNYLAFTLVASGEDGAAAVFNEIGPYATNAPWETFSTSLRRDWHSEFLRMRASVVRPRVRHR
ncbi:hypothetical protein [Streptomyces sp. NBC_00425]|uniref:hypothetical protein n=1 Tax=Streptomyces sp. NBC_00425 TaxID=2975740 RepID=UPI002E1AB6D4